MSKSISISMSITEEAYNRWEKIKKELGMTQGDAMTRVLMKVKLLSLKEPLSRRDRAEEEEKT